MNKYKARHWKTDHEIEVEFLTLEEAVQSNKGYYNWEKVD